MLRFLRYGLMVAGLCLLTLTAWLLISRQQKAQSPWLAYDSIDQGNIEIYRARLDGSQPVNVTNNPANDFFLGWGPDGKWMIFASDRVQGKGVLYRMSPLGTNIELMDEPQYPTAPHVSASTYAASPPVDLRLRTPLMAAIGALLVGVGILAVRQGNRIKN